MTFVAERIVLCEAAQLRNRLQACGAWRLMQALSA